MRNLPTAETYEKEYEYFPWGELIDEIAKFIFCRVPKKGKIIDLMCGTGYLLRKVHEKRPSLTLVGVDINEGFIDHARAKYSSIYFKVGDVLVWESSLKYDAVICTGGIHHLSYPNQLKLIRRISEMINIHGIAILADPFIDDYRNENDRKCAAAKLGYKYLLATIKNGAPNELIETAIDILHNDVMGFEFKTALEKFLPVLKQFFVVEIKKVWPKRSSNKYGDYYFICRTKEKNHELP